jgi:type II secretory pathway component PulC
MDINEVLKKTKHKADKMQLLRVSQHIATEDRPYSIEKEKSKEPLEKKEIISGKKQDNVINNSGNFYLIGTQLVIAQALISKIEKDNITTKIFIKHFAQECGILNEDIVRTGIKRLEKKGAISFVDSKTGRGGWALFKVSQDVIEEIKNNNLL